MTSAERAQVRRALTYGPTYTTAAAKRRADENRRREERHSLVEAEYERAMVAAATRAATIHALALVDALAAMERGR